MIKSYERMFAILELFSMERTTLSISEIEGELGYPKSTIFRILNTLISGGFIQRNPDTHLYSLGVQFFKLGTIYQSQLDLRKIALPVMTELANKSSETIELNIIDGINRLCIEKVDSSQQVRSFVQIGDRHPVHSGASGKILLAFLAVEEKERAIELLKNKYEIDIRHLKEDLDTIKKDGYAFTRGERVHGSFAVSAPIFDVNGQLLAGLTLAGPIQRLSEERENNLIHLLTKGARNISEQFGYKY